MVICTDTWIDTHTLIYMYKYIHTHMYMYIYIERTFLIVA